MEELCQCKYFLSVFLKCLRFIDLFLKNFKFIACASLKLYDYYPILNDPKRLILLPRVLKAFQCIHLHRNFKLRYLSALFT